MMPPHRGAQSRRELTHIGGTYSPATDQRSTRHREQGYSFAEIVSACAPLIRCLWQVAVGCTNAPAPVRRPFVLRALIEERLGSHTDWNAVDSLMLKALGAAEKVARYRHAQLSAVKLAGELKHGPADGATLEELLERIKAEL